MKMKHLGRGGPAVSRLCLGTMMFGSRTGPEEARRIVAHAMDAGVNFLDCADAYSGGRAEEIVAAATRGSRDRWVIATKVGNPMGEDPARRGLGRAWLAIACEESLRRLETDRIDLYYLHLEDKTTPLEETIEAIGRLITQGKILRFGISNFRAWRIAEVIRLCDRLGVPYPVASQPCYNALNRMPEVEHLPACTHYGMAVVPYSPLARGVLTGKYAPGAAPAAATRAGRGDARMMESEWRSESLTIAQTLKAHAEAKGITAGQFATAWVLANPLVTAVLAGPRTLAQWQDYLGALAYRLDSADEALVDRLVAPGHPSTPGFNDPRYPLEGRPADAAVR